MARRQPRAASPGVAAAGGIVVRHGWRDESLLRIPEWLTALERRLLYLWVRTTVFPENPQELALDPAKPVCYVLQDRHFANRLVLVEETRRAGLPLRRDTDHRRPAAPPAALVLLPQPRAQPQRRRARPGRQRLAVPRWPDPPPAGEWPGRRATGAGRASCGDAARKSRTRSSRRSFPKPGARRGAGATSPAVLLHGRNVLVRYNPPISLRAFLQDGLGEEQALRKLSRILRVHFRRQRQMAIGPDLSHRNMQVERRARRRARARGDHPRGGNPWHLARRSARARLRLRPGDRFRLLLRCRAGTGDLPVVVVEPPLRRYRAAQFRRADAHRPRPGNRLRAVPPQPHRLPAAFLRDSSARA